uniref:Uncharacterized protein n=1 Tax=Romanomermis culicivorax TaxID=13658 RepID=A0A915IQ22_ROMCU
MTTMGVTGNAVKHNRISAAINPIKKIFLAIPKKSGGSEHNVKLECRGIVVPPSGSNSLNYYKNWPDPSPYMCNICLRATTHGLTFHDSFNNHSYDRNNWYFPTGVSLEFFVSRDEIQILPCGAFKRCLSILQLSEKRSSQRTNIVKDSKQSANEMVGETPHNR